MAFVCSSLLCAAQPEDQIRSVLATQVAAWNRGDIPAFVSTYAEDCVFAGKKVLHGRQALLNRYRTTYATPAAMGQLVFANLEVRPIDHSVATVTGEWRLARSTAAGGPTGGIFSLVFRLQKGVWLIALDHTSN